MSVPRDVRWMYRALDLARQGIGQVSPNPAVGAVIVKHERLVAEGYHRRFGGPHAEVEALQVARGRAQGATLYVTLEPCSHFGKTPPCTERIIRSGIRRVIAASLDPNPVNHGQGIARLEKAGIETSVGMCEAEARTLNAPFFKFMERHLPFIIVKAAASLDGKIATTAGESKWITGEQSRARGRWLRSKVDGILVGSHTVEQDDCHLLGAGSRHPQRIVLDSGLRISPRARVLQQQHLAPTIVFTTHRAPQARRRSLQQQGLQVITVGYDARGVSLSDVLRELADRHITTLLVEGGGTVIASFVETGNVDQLYLFLSPRIIGGSRAPTWVEGIGINHLEATPWIHLDSVERSGEDLLIRGRVLPAHGASPEAAHTSSV